MIDENVVPLKHSISGIPGPQAQIRFFISMKEILRKQANALEHFAPNRDSASGERASMPFPSKPAAFIHSLRKLWPDHLKRNNSQIRLAIHPLDDSPASVGIDEPAIVVQADDIFTTCPPQNVVPRRDRSAVDFPPHEINFREIAQNHFRRAVGRSVVNDQHFAGDASVVPAAFQRLMQLSRPIPRGNHERDIHLSRHRLRSARPKTWRIDCSKRVAHHRSF